MQVITTYSHPQEAHLALSRLEGNGVAGRVWDDEIVGLIWMYSAAVGGVKLVVATEDVERAREILELPPVAPGMFSCPRCKSDHVKIRELNLFTAICLGLGFILPLKSKTVDCLECNHAFPLRARDQKDTHG